MSNQPTVEILFSMLSEDDLQRTALPWGGRRAIVERVEDVQSGEGLAEPRTSAHWPVEVFELVDQIARGMDSVTSADVEAFRDELYAEELYEVVVTAALAADRERLKLGPAVFGGEDTDQQSDAA